MRLKEFETGPLQEMPEGWFQADIRIVLTGGDGGETLIHLRCSTRRASDQSDPERALLADALRQIGNMPEYRGGPGPEVDRIAG